VLVTSAELYSHIYLFIYNKHLINVYAEIADVTQLIPVTVALKWKPKIYKKFVKK